MSLFGKFFCYLGYLMIVLSIVSPLILHFVANGTPFESFSKDFVGLPISEPPLWVYNTQYFWVFLLVIFRLLDFFGRQGLVLGGVALMVIYLGDSLEHIGKGDFRSR